MPHAPPEPDLWLIGPDGGTIAAVDLRGRLGGDPYGAARHLVMQAADAAGAEFAALLTPDRLRVWTRDGTLSADADATDFLRPFFRKARVLPHQIGGGGFEMLGTLAFDVLCDPRPESWGEEFAEVGRLLAEAAPAFAAAVSGAEVRATREAAVAA